MVTVLVIVVVPFVFRFLVRVVVESKDVLAGKERRKHVCVPREGNPER
jgi:hypothetical protein